MMSKEMMLGFLCAVSFTVCADVCIIEQFVPVFIVDKNEREAQIKEFSNLTPEEVIDPLATGIFSGFVYASFYNQLLRAGMYNADTGRTNKTEILCVMEAALVGVGIHMAKKFYFGQSYQKEKKRNTIDSIDTIATIMTFLLFR